MNMVEEAGKIWMALIDKNGICEIDKAARKAKICKIFEDEPMDGEALYCHTAKTGHFLIFSPGTANKIAIYDLERDYLTYIALKKIGFHCKQNQNEIKFWNILQHHSDVYLLGYSYPAIVKINIESMEILYITDWVKDVEAQIKDDETTGYFGDGYVIIDNLALIPLGCINAILELDFSTNQTQLKKIDVSMKGIGGISSEDRNHIWMVGKGARTNRVACWNRKINEIKEFHLSDFDENLFDPFYAPICTSDKIIFIPISAPCFYEIDINTGIIKKSRILEREYNEEPLWNWWKIMAPKLQDRCLTYLTCDDLGWHEYNLVTGESQDYYIHLESTAETERYLEAFYSQLAEKKQEFQEKKIPLEYFLDKEINPNKKRKHRWNDFIVGEKIYGQVFKTV